MRRPLWTTTALLTLAAALAAAEPRLVFEDSFSGDLAAGWSWLREDPSAWRIAGEALEIRAQPGLAHNVKNALVRKAPDRSQGKFAIEITVTSTSAPTEQYEQAGITWYHAGKPVFKLVKERIDGQLFIIPGRVPLQCNTVQLRLIVTVGAWTAQFRPDGKGEYRTAATGQLPPPDADQVSIQCYHGPPDTEHWIRFDNFRIEQLPE